MNTYTRCLVIAALVGSLTTSTINLSSEARGGFRAAGFSGGGLSHFSNFHSSNFGGLAHNFHNFGGMRTNGLRSNEGMGRFEHEPVAQNSFNGTPVSNWNGNPKNYSPANYTPSQAYGNPNMAYGQNMMSQRHRFFHWPFGRQNNNGFSGGNMPGGQSPITQSPFANGGNRYHYMQAMNGGENSGGSSTSPLNNIPNFGSGGSYRPEEREGAGYPQGGSEPEPHQ